MDDQVLIERAQVKARESAARLRAAVEELMSGERSLLEVRPPEDRGLVFWLLRDPTSTEGFRMIARTSATEGLSKSAVGFGASESRPNEYPADLPFVEHCAAIINPSGPAVRVHWVDPGNPLVSLRGIVEECESTGWTRSNDAPIDLASRATRYVELKKGDRVRVAILRIHGNAGELELLEDDE